jgi:hypothetical protein
MLNHDMVDQLMAVSYMYFSLNEKNSVDVSASELEELIVAINDSNEAMDGCENYLV